MSMVDQTPDLGYDDEQEGRITVADVLQRLKEELAAQRATLADAKRAVQHLELAIGAIERDEAESKKQIARQRPTSKRGYLANAVIESLQEGVGTVSAIVRRLQQQGITTTKPSVSNVIQRLQARRQIHFDKMKQMWVLSATQEDQTDTVFAQQR
jgi:hypothetical protein